MNNDHIHVAIVDDHSMVRKGLASLVGLFPRYKVLFDAANGKDFIRQLKPMYLPAIVLLDINMPEMDGYATAEWISKNHPEIKVLALSTMDNDQAIIRMIRCGAKGYILKDADPAELKVALDEILTMGVYYNDVVSRKLVRSINELAADKSDLANLVKLTDKEIQFLKLACSEKSYQEIAEEMFVSPRTVDGYRDNLFRKLNVSTRVGLVLYALKNKITAIE
jgi:DNA-binding NarL/FixJ family response regulator